VNIGQMRKDCSAWDITETLAWLKYCDLEELSGVFVEKKLNGSCCELLREYPQMVTEILEDVPNSKYLVRRLQSALACRDKVSAKWKWEVAKISNPL